MHSSMDFGIPGLVRLAVVGLVALTLVVLVALFGVGYLLYWWMN